MKRVITLCVVFLAISMTGCASISGASKPDLERSPCAVEEAE